MVYFSGLKYPLMTLLLVHRTWQCGVSYLVSELTQTNIFAVFTILMMGYFI